MKTALDAGRRLGARDRHRRPHRGGGRRRDARRPRRHHRARPEARRGARRRGQLRRQARAPPFSSAGSAAREARCVLTLNGAPAAAAATCRRSCRIALARRACADDRRHRAADDADAGDGRRCLPAARRRRARHPHRGRLRPSRPASAQGMTAGAIAVEGDVGSQAGRRDGAAGASPSQGNAGRWAGSGMTRRRDRDHRVMPATGSAARCAGEMSGMRGGLIVVRGNAGERAGDRMRRGTIIVEGAAAPCRQPHDRRHADRAAQGRAAAGLSHAPRHDRAGRRLRRAISDLHRQRHARARRDAAAGGFRQRL